MKREKRRDLLRDRYGQARYPAFASSLTTFVDHPKTPDQGHVMSGSSVASVLLFSRIRFRAAESGGTLTQTPMRMWIGYVVWLLARNSQLVKLHVLNQKPP